MYYYFFINEIAHFCHVFFSGTITSYFIFQLLCLLVLSALVKIFLSLSPFKCFQMLSFAKFVFFFILKIVLEDLILMAIFLLKHKLESNKYFTEENKC